MFLITKISIYLLVNYKQKLFCAFYRLSLVYYFEIIYPVRVAVYKIVILHCKQLCMFIKTRNFLKKTKF